VSTLGIAGREAKTTWEAGMIDVLASVAASFEALAAEIFTYIKRLCQHTDA